MVKLLLRVIITKQLLLHVTGTLAWFETSCHWCCHCGSFHTSVSSRLCSGKLGESYLGWFYVSVSIFLWYIEKVFCRKHSHHAPCWLGPSKASSSLLLSLTCTIFFHLSPYIMLLTLPLITVHMIHIIYESFIWSGSPQVNSRSSAVRASHWCVEGHKVWFVLWT